MESKGAAPSLVQIVQICLSVVFVFVLVLVSFHIYLSFAFFGSFFHVQTTTLSEQGLTFKAGESLTNCCSCKKTPGRKV